MDVPHNFIIFPRQRMLCRITESTVSADTADRFADTFFCFHPKQFLRCFIYRKNFRLTRHHKSIFHIFSYCQIFFMTFPLFLKLCCNLLILFMDSHKQRAKLFIFHMAERMFQIQFIDRFYQTACLPLHHKESYNNDNKYKNSHQCNTGLEKRQHGIHRSRHTQHFTIRKSHCIIISLLG